ncbi:hypothetical protein [Ornithinimicrobium sp. W1665]|uniref:hypothetical protein n=1 Tax=Ornithinimicrobium sp. W1665 TaxID=3416666 RepID=UPI003CFAF988
MTAALTVVGDDILTEEAARAGVRRRVRRSLTQTAGQLLLHPIWVARVEVIADRPPFAPLVRRRLVFVDGVSEYRGLLEAVPPVRQVAVQEEAWGSHAGRAGEYRARMDGELVAVHRTVVDRDRAVELVQDVQVRQINRSYALRKPRHRILDVVIQHLPLWRFQTRTGHVATVNAVTGADESYLASRW